MSPISEKRLRRLLSSINFCLVILWNKNWNNQQRISNLSVLTSTTKIFSTDVHQDFWEEERKKIRKPWNSLAQDKLRDTKGSLGRKKFCKLNRNDGYTNECYHWHQRSQNLKCGVFKSSVIWEQPDCTSIQWSREYDEEKHPINMIDHGGHHDKNLTQCARGFPRI